MFRRLSLAPLAFLALAACHAPPPTPETMAVSALPPPTPIATNDRAKILQAEKRAYIAAIGQRITWNNPDSGDSGTIAPVRDFYDANGLYCREFRQTATTSGLRQQDSDVACQQPDGSWKQRSQ